jgi:acetyl esterase/lipase
LPLDRQARRFLDMLAAGGGADAGYVTVEQRRRALEDLASWTAGDPPDVSGVKDDVLPGPNGPIRMRLYAPLGAAERRLPGMVFFHGGGWVAGSLDTHDGVCRRLANASGCRVVAVDYRLAPEHPFPAAIEDAEAAVHAVADAAEALGIDSAHLGVAGDSAGAGLAAAVCQKARVGGPAIAFQLLICPILDVAAESASRIELAEGYFLGRATLERDLELYAPPTLDDPRISPLRAQDLTGLPPASIHTAEFDPFRDEGRAYAARLQAAGVAVAETCHEGMIHYFYAMPRVIGHAEAALNAMGENIARLCDRS